MGARRPSVPRPQPCPLSQFGRSVPRPCRTDGPKRASGRCIVQRESLLGQATTAPTRLGSGKQRKPFSPPALRSPMGKEGRSCPWLPGPSVFAGGLRCPKPTPHGFVLSGKQDWGREGLLRPGCIMPPEPARPLCAEALSHRRPKTSFWQLHSAKGKSPRAAKNSPIVPRLMKATQAVFAPGPPLSRGQSRAGLPLAPWDLLICWGSPVPETHSPRVLLRGEAGLGARILLRPGPRHAPLASSAAQRLGPVAPTAPNNLLACLLYTSPSPRDRLTSRMPSSA